MRCTPVDLALEWCTILGNGSREQFELAVTDLCPDRANAVLSALELVGHVEVDWDHTGSWSVNPAALALPVGSGGNAFLVGGRNEATFRAIDELQRAGRIESFTVIPGGRIHASAWFLGVQGMDQIDEAAATIGATVTVDPATLLMERFVDLDHILLAHRTEYVPSGFGAKQLNVQTMRYEPVDVKYANWRPGCFEQLSSGRRRYIFVDDNNDRYVCDRWIATHAEIRRQRRAGRRVPHVLRWDMSRERMAVLASAQLPTYWGRAAALCSGLPPRRVEGAQWIDIYEGVRLLMYGKFCRALDIPPSTTDLGDYDEDQH